MANNIKVSFDSADLAILKNAMHESDRGCVITGCAMVERNIDTLLPEKLVSRSDFWTKIEIVGIFLPKKIYDILHAMRDARNKAAHTADVFQLDKLGQPFSNNIVSATEKLKVYKDLKSALPSAMNIAIPKVQFVICAAVVSAYIKATGHLVDDGMRNTTLNFN
jgi:hypothetical protein